MKKNNAKIKDIPVVAEEVQFTPEEIQEQKAKILDKITESILFNQMAYNKLHEVRLTPFFNNKLKTALKQVNIQLLKSEKKHFDKFFENVEDSAQGLLNLQEDLVAEITSVGYEEFENLTNIIKEYKKDKSRMKSFIDDQLPETPKFIKNDFLGNSIFVGTVFTFDFMIELNEKINLEGCFFYNDEELRFEIEIFNNSDYIVLSYVSNGVMSNFKVK